MTKKNEYNLEETREVTPEWQLTWPLTASVLSILAGTFVAGLCLGALNSPAPFIQQFMNETSISRGDGAMTESTLSQLYALLSAVLALGGCVGALATHRLADLLGRKRLLALICLLYLGSALLMGLCTQAHSYEILFVGRALSGLATGVFSSLSPVYLTELVPRSLTGPALVANQLTVQLASVLISIIGYEELLVNPAFWPLAISCHGVVAVLQLLLLPWVMPSPFYLVSVKQDEVQATRVLTKLRGTTDVSTELSSLQQIVKTRKQQSQMTVMTLLKTASLRRPLLVCAMAFGNVFLTGILVIVFYSVSLLVSAGLNPRNARYASTGVTAFGVVVSVMMLRVIQGARRRRLMLTGMVGVIVLGAVFSLALIFRDNGYWIRIVGIVCVPLFAGVHSVGPACLPWILIPELFPPSARGAASSVCLLVFWLAIFLVGYAFPPMQESIEVYSFLPFVGMAVLFAVFFFFVMPETVATTPREETVDVEDDESSGKQEQMTGL